MQDPPLHPVMEIPVPATLDARNQFAAVAFDAASSKLLIRASIQPINPRTWLKIHAIDVAGAAICVFSVILIWLTLRVLRRPQRAGLAYCRRCNYEVSPGSTHKADESRRCAECGISLLKRSPVRGRSTFSRLLQVGFVFVPLLCVSIVVWCHKIERKTSNNMAWPIRSLGYLKWWPIGKSLEPLQRSLVIQQYSLPDVRQISAVTIENDPFNYSFSKDLQYVAYADLLIDSGYENRAVIRDLSQKREHSIPFGNFNSGLLAFHGYTSDESRAIYTFASAADSSGNSDVALFTLSLQTFARQDIVSIKVPATPVAQGIWQPPEVLAALSATSMQWVIAPVISPARGSLIYGTTSGGTAPATVALSFAGTPHRFMTIGFVNPTSLRFVDRTTGRLPFDVALPTGLISYPSLPTERTTRTVSGEVLILQGETIERRMNIHSDLRPPGWNDGVFSRDGRWLAYPVTRRDGRRVVVLIDLSISDK